MHGHRGRVNAVMVGVGADLGCLPTAPPHQIRSVDPLLIPMTLLLQHPGDWRPVWSYQIRGPDRIRVCGVSPRGDDTMHVADAYRSAPSLESPFEDVIDCLVPAQNIDWYSEDVFPHPA